MAHNPTPLHDTTCQTLHVASSTVVHVVHRRDCEGGVGQRRQLGFEVQIEIVVRRHAVVDGELCGDLRGDRSALGIVDQLNAQSYH
jgi:hypothetical protein